MYDAVFDPYCYPGTTVLRNRLDLRRQEDLDAFEHEAALIRSDEPLPDGRLGVRHYRAIHHHLFQDVYDWAGRFRTVRIAKGGSMFCYPEHITSEMERLFRGLRSRFIRPRIDAATFVVQATGFLATLNAIHPFREGNGRTQLTFLALLANDAGHPLNFEPMVPEAILDAMVQSFSGDETALRAAILALIEPSADR